MSNPTAKEQGMLVNGADYPYLMPWDRKPAAIAAFEAYNGRKPETDLEMAWINGYVACIEDLPR